MTIDKEQCPVCGELSYLDGKCYSCGYDDSMQRKFQYNIGITAPAAANGTIAGTYNGSALSNGDDLPYGSEIIFTASANATNHKQFITWVISGSCYYASLTDNPIKITIYGDVTITATFATKKTLTVSAITSGNMTVDGVLVDPAGEVLYFNVDQVIEVVAIPDDYFEFIEWGGDATVVEGKIVMDDDYTLSVTFDDAISGYKLICIDDKDSSHIPIASIEMETIVDTVVDAENSTVEIHIDTT